VLFGGETGEDGEDKLKEENSTVSKSEMFLPIARSKEVGLQHNACASKGTFGLLTVVDVVWVMGHRTRFCDVPRGAGLRMLWIAHI
jgi:hypothetical protein